MCGISGIISNSSLNINEILAHIAKSMSHRGPDGEGIFVHNNVGIGHRRLSIIDIEGGKQPLFDETKKLWITYNGELYNYKELRKELIGEGFVFRTESDTEVILQSYSHWGISCLSRFRGMFAFGILDLNKEEFFLARDHFGIKPLVYATGSGVFAFASEIQALKPIQTIDWSININALDQYLAYQFIPAPNTIYNSVFKLPPAHFMRVNFNSQIIEFKKYWELSFLPDHSKDEKYWIEAIEGVINESINSHLVSDVPFGAFLSGGVDSSLVVGNMAKLMPRSVKTFSIGFEEHDYSELKYARQVASYWGTDHYEEIVRPDALAILPDLVSHFGEPFGDSSAIPTFYVSKLAKNQVKMVLSGDAGDELFAGYESYTNRWTRNLNPVPEHLSPLKKSLYSGLNNLFPKRYPLRTSGLSDWQKYILYNSKEDRMNIWKPEYFPNFRNTDLVHSDLWKNSSTLSHFNKVQNLDFNTYLPNDILSKVDIVSMMNGLEVRTPLLDVRVVELASKIPEKYNINKNFGTWEGKRLLKKIVSKDHGDEFGFRKKMGFSIPIHDWLSKSKSEMEDRILSSGNGLDQFFNREALESVAKGRNAGKQWLLIFLQEWFSQNKV